MRASQLLQGPLKMIALTSKRGNKNFYKGRGAPSIGHHRKNTAHKTRQYTMNQEKLYAQTFIRPSLEGFPLMAYAEPNQDKAESIRNRQLVRRQQEAMQRQGGIQTSAIEATQQ